MGKYAGLEADANAAIKELMYVVEQAASAEPEVAAHPTYLAEQRRVVVRRIWALVKRSMLLLEKLQHESVTGPHG
jgi:hypothetical protein